jgi:hypothetical protein
MHDRGHLVDAVPPAVGVVAFSIDESHPDA